MTAINQLDGALEYLRQKGCRRDPGIGQWLNSDGDPLASDPIGAARELRQLIVKRAVERSRGNTTGMHR